MMPPPPNQLYTVFSFIGFVMCAIPMYWHLKAQNIGTCLYMAWTGLGCLIQCVNSIMWNKNMVNRAPVYCDIVARIQAGHNAAIPACSLCINRRLYKISTAQTSIVTRAEKRREVIIELLIGLGIPILQIVAQYVVSGRRYVIYEDVGPMLYTAPRIPSVPLFSAWPVVIGCVSFVYCVRTIYHLYKRQHLRNEIISSKYGVNRSLYIRLMMLAGAEILGTIPLGSFIIVLDVKDGLRPWVSWADVHRNYFKIMQIPSSVWKHGRNSAIGGELYRWLLVLCAFVFFAFFGFADEARQNYRHAYWSLASLFNHSTSSGTAIGSLHATSSLPQLKSNTRGAMISVVKTRIRRDSTVSFSDQLSVPSTSTPSEPKLDVAIDQVPLPEPTAPSASSSADGSQGQSLQPPKTTSGIVPASVPPQLPDTVNSTIASTSTFFSDAADTV
ncbi:pheromone A receptor-domain-containing protein [Lactifluus subvellereus]|nr:pheromone A receptor-domain-containing protein [Lactifluus subvellereus]